MCRGQANQEGKKTMACSQFSRFLISLVVLGNIPSAHAQGTSQYEYGGGGSYATRPGGFYGTGGYSGGGVPTGRGPLSQPIPPAASLRNPRQNYYYYPQTPYRNYWGPTATNPPQYPFGAR
jgi:hypothetical protein